MATTQLDVIALCLITLEQIKIKTCVRGLNALEFNAWQHGNIYNMIPIVEIIIMSFNGSRNDKNAWNNTNSPLLFLIFLLIGHFY